MCIKLWKSRVKGFMTLGFLGGLLGVMATWIK